MRYLLAFASDHVQTAKITCRLAAALEEDGGEARVIDVRDTRHPIAFDHYDAVIVGASLHNRRFQEPIADFVSRHLDELCARPTAFFSVSLSAADPNPARHRQLADSIERFQQETGWRPACFASFAGSLPHARMNWLMRLFWRDLDREPREYTDWATVTKFAREFASAARAGKRARLQRPPDPGGPDARG